MPIITIDTSLKREEIPDSFLTEATDFLASELGKPKSYVCVKVNPDQIMSFGGTTEPCALLTVHSIGVVGPEKNRSMAPVVSKFIEEKLGIKKDRFYVNIYDVARPTCIWNGTTFG